MMRWLGLGAVCALFVVGAGCSCATTQLTDSGLAFDGGADAATPAVDTGVDAPTPTIDTGADAPTPTVDTGVDAPTTPDAGHDAAPRADAGMCVDGLPDPTRPVATTCSACRPPGTSTGTGPGCTSDADCHDTTMGSNGRCTFGRIGTFCTYDHCFADTDCMTNEVCLCDGQNGGGNVCVSSNCRVDSDCGGGRACSPTFGSCGHFSGFVAYRCHTAADTCHVDSDCAAGYCAFDETAAHWECSTSECAG